MKLSNKITGANVGGRRPLAMRTRWTAFVAQFCPSPMRRLRLVACFALLGFTCGCREKRDLARLQEDSLTVADVAWATDTTIFKWKLRELNAKPIYSVGIVVLGPTNNVPATGPRLTEGRSALSYFPGELSLAMRNPESGPDLGLKLRCNGQSTWWRPREEFKVFSSVSVAPRPIAPSWSLQSKQPTKPVSLRLLTTGSIQDARSCA